MSTAKDAIALINQFKSGKITDLEFLRQMRLLGWSPGAATQVMVKIKEEMRETADKEQA